MCLVFLFMTFYTDTETGFTCDILLPSNKTWRMKNYFKLVEQQRALDALPMPAVWPEKLQQEWSTSAQPDAKRPRRSSLDFGLSLTSTISVETTWTASDIAKAGGLLTIPPRSVSFEDEEEMRRVYSLIYDVFRYKSVLQQALMDTAFFILYPQKQPNLVWLLFYDLYKRRFLPRDHHDEQVRVQLFEESGLLEADVLLWSLRVKLAASVARLRIKNNALRLVEEVKRLVEKAGLSPLNPKLQKMDIYGYEFDKVCPKFIKFHPSQRSDLAQSTLDRAFCLGPSMICNILIELDLAGNVVQTHINSPRTMAYLANILVDNEKIDNLIAFGAGERKEEYEEYLRELGVTNTEVHAEKFVDISSESEILENVVAVLATPPNTYSGVIDPVDLVCSRGGDLSMLEVLTDTEIGGGSLERIQVVLYETHSIVSAENSEMVTQLVNEMNNGAREKHAEEQGKPLPSPSFISTSSKKEGSDIGHFVAGGDTTIPSTNSIISVEIVPHCDLFELSALPDQSPEDEVCVTMEKEGCYLAYLRRKEIVRLNAKYMINIAESRGLFGGEGSGSKEGKKSAGRQHRKKPELQRSGSASPPLIRPRSRRKVEVDRIAAPTQASILRRATDPGKRGLGSLQDSSGLLQPVICCPRHQTHLQQDSAAMIGTNPKLAAQIKRQDARRWWGEAAKHIMMFGFNIDLEEPDAPADEIEKPILKLTRTRPNGRVPFPISVTSLQFDKPQEQIQPLQECFMV
ncbi:hypothetical protein C0J52_12418 [Blattella germanica]|nr:hypothetical protein C0J52_12418 [Blattella germanica]